MQNHISKYEVLLASSSKRRHELLDKMKIKFKILKQDVDEYFSNELKESEITEFLAKKKSNFFYKKLKNNQILITCDTIVWHEYKAFGKPQNLTEAVKMLNCLNNKMHKVFSSICLSTKGRQIIVSQETKVFFRKLEPWQIKHYVENYDVLDRAGAYGVQDYIGHIGIEKIEGSYNNVLGFPTTRFIDALNKIDISI